MKKYLFNLSMAGMSLMPTIVVTSCTSAGGEKDKQKKLLSLKKKFNDAGANIEGHSDVSIIARVAKNIEEFKEVLLLSGEKLSNNNTFASGVKGLSNNIIKAIYDFYKKDSNKDISLVKMLAFNSFIRTEGDLNKIMNFRDNIRDIMLGFSNEDFLWISQKDKEEIEISKNNIINALGASEGLTKISWIAENSEDIDEFIQGIIFMGGIQSGNNKSSAGIMNLDYFQIKKIYNFYKNEYGDPINKYISITTAIKKLHLNPDIINAFPKEKFVLTHASDLVGANNGKTSVSLIIMNSKSIKEFMQALMIAGIPTTNFRPTRLGDGQIISELTIGTRILELGNHNSYATNLFSGVALKNLFKYFNKNKNKKIGVDLALRSMLHTTRTHPEGVVYKESEIIDFLKLFKREIFVYQEDIKDNF